MDSIPWKDFFPPPGEAQKSYAFRYESRFFERFCAGPMVLEVGHAGYDNPEKKTALPHAIGVDLDYPGYDGLRLPFEDGSIDTVFSSHCLEHILDYQAVIRDWFRVTKEYGFIVCIVPDKFLYEKRHELPSRWNHDHKRFYTPASLLAEFEQALATNSYRIRHLRENDDGYNYDVTPERHAEGCYEIELVIQKIPTPRWTLE